MPFRVTILGSNSAIPTTKRKPTAQLLNVAERFLLIDCGEGTQMQLRQVQDKMQRISHVYIAFTWRSLLWIDWFDIFHAFIRKRKRIACICRS